MPEVGGDSTVKVRALTASEVRAEFGCLTDADGLPARRSVADIIRRLLTVRGVLNPDALITAVAGLAAPGPARSDAVTVRLKSVLEQMQAAGEVQQARSAAGVVCWLASPVEVSLPDGRTLLLGQCGDSAPNGVDDDLFPNGFAPDAQALIDYLGPPSYRFDLKMLGVAGWRDASPGDVAGALSAAAQDQTPPESTSANGLGAWIGTPRFETTVLTPGFANLPDQVRRALALTARPLDDSLSSWSLAPAIGAELDAWLGRPDRSDVEDDEAADPGQERVLGASVSRRLIVEAGPGSGKTRVACGRVARLIDDGAAATRIFMISFTQAAVGELRARIGGFLADPGEAGDVQIATLDSLAGGFRSGFGLNDRQMGFEGGIGGALDLLKAGDRGLVSYLGTLEHVIIDEAQDLTGDRRDLVEALVRALPASCGVTLFEDPAQAIYDWAGGTGGSLSSTLLSAPELSFSKVILDRDHRTRDPELKRLKAELREVLQSGQEPAAIYHAVRAAIETVAEPSSILSQPGSIPRSTLVLFRGRGELLSAAARFWRDGLPVRVRLTGRSKSTAAWIGSLFRASEATSLSRGDFDLLWRDLWPRPGALSADDAWRTLRTIAGVGPRGGVDLLRLGRRIDTPSPPLAVALSSTGRAGPILSTIHGSKGQESEHVVLALPRAAGVPPLEEARVLFVAATRARTSLSVAAARPVSGEPFRDRVWSRWRDGHARIEIGVDGDVDVLRTAFPDGEDSSITEARQQTLWAVSDTPIALRAIRRTSGWNLIADGGTFDGRDLGFLSDGVSTDLRAIGRDRHGGALPGSTLRGLFVVGTRTVVLETPDGAVRFGLAPVVAGLAFVYFNPAAVAGPAGAAA